MQWLSFDLGGAGRSPDADLRVMYQRVLAIDAGTRDRVARSGLPSETEAILRGIYNRLDEETGAGGIAGRLKTLLAQKLLPFARLVSIRDKIRQPRDFPDELMNVPDVGDDLTAEFLQDLDPGWRMIGLARLAIDPKPSLFSQMFGAIGFESTFEGHLRLFVRAAAAMVQRDPTMTLEADQRSRLESICRNARGDAAAQKVMQWLARTAQPAPVNLRRRWANLVEEYTRIRREQGPGAQRTANMTAVVDRMRSVAREDRGFDVLVRLRDRDRAWRLAAAAFIYELPGRRYFKPLIESLQKFHTLPARTATDNRPFGDYWALLALEKVATAAGALTGDDQALIATLNDLIPPQTDRRAVLDRIVGRHVSRQAPSKSTAPRKRPPKKKK